MSRSTHSVDPGRRLRQAPVVQSDAAVRGRIDLLLERLLRIRVMRLSHMPSGLDLHQDIRRFLPGWEVRTVLDVGASRGETAQCFAAWFPDAVVHSFEPEADSYATMVHRLQARPRHRLHNLAVGATEESVVVRAAGPLSRVEPAADMGETQDPTGQIAQCVSLDAFCAREDLNHVGLLKVDTEGRDLEVLHGAAGLLAARRIDMIQVEAGMSPRNSLHVALDRFKTFLERHGYLLFGIYDQMHEFDGEPQLRRANPVFISESLCDGIRWHAMAQTRRLRPETPPKKSAIKPRWRRHGGQ